jgi:Skp family chaperone for outer membrane proteins
VAKRKKNLLASIPQEYKTMAFALLFLFLGIITLIGDTKSVIGFEMFKILSQAFGDFYKWIFAPVLILLGLFLFKEKTLHFNTYRATGLLFFYVSSTTLIGWYDRDYQALFNVYLSLENILGRTPLFFCFLVLFFASLFILFRFSVVHHAIQAGKSLPNLANIKESYGAEKQISKLKREAREVESKAHKIEREEKHMKRESEDLEKKLEELRKEKEMLAKMKQPKQLQLERQADRKVSVAQSATGAISSLFGNKETSTSEK